MAPAATKSAPIAAAAIPRYGRMNGSKVLSGAKEFERGRSEVLAMPA
jgi:hypothetical protein